MSDLTITIHTAIAEAGHTLLTLTLHPDYNARGLEAFKLRTNKGEFDVFRALNDSHIEVRLVRDGLPRVGYMLSHCASTLASCMRKLVDGGVAS